MMGETGIAPTQMGKIRFVVRAARLLGFLSVKFKLHLLPEENVDTISRNEEYNSLKA